MKRDKTSNKKLFFKIKFFFWMNSLFLLRKFSKAKNYIEKNMNNCGESSTLHWYLGMAYRKQHKIEEAIKEFKKSQELDPEDPWIYFDLVKLNYKIGYFSEVLKYGEELLKKKFFGMKAFAKNQLLFYLPWYLGMAYSYQSEYEKAVTYLNKAFDNKMNDKDKAFILERLGYCYRELNRFDDALVNLKKAIELAPKLHIAHFNLGVLFDKLEQHEKSIPEFLEALKGEPDNIATNFMLSRSYYLTEQFEESEKYMRKLIQLNPNESKFYFLLGDIAERNQNYQLAIENYEKALELDPNNEEIKIALESARSDSWKSGINIERWGLDFGQHTGTF